MSINRQSSLQVTKGIQINTILIGNRMWVELRLKSLLQLSTESVAI